MQRLLRETPDSLLAPDAELLAASLEKDLGQNSEGLGPAKEDIGQASGGFEPHAAPASQGAFGRNLRSRRPAPGGGQGFVVDLAKGQGPDIVKGAAQRVSQLAGRLPSKDIESLLVGEVSSPR